MLVALAALALTSGAEDILARVDEHQHRVERMTLEHVDSAIAFAVIMLGASLLIMILTQAASSLLNLRGQHLERSLRDLLQTLCPALNDRAEVLTKQILEHPLLSDSRFGSTEHHDRRYRRILAIAGGVAGGLLGTAFVEGLERKLSVGVAGGIAVAFALNHLSKTWELASTVRLDELVRTLSLVDKDTAAELAAPAPNAALTQQLAHLEEMAKECGQALTNAVEQLRARVDDPSIGELLDVVLARIGSDADKLARLKRLRQRVAPELSSMVDGLVEIVAAERAISFDKSKLLVSLQEAVDRRMKDAEVLFNAAMDRASQRFAANSRLWTIGFSLVFVFLAHLDAIALYKRVSSDAELRARLVASSDAMMKQADKSLNGAPVPSVSITPPAPAASGRSAPAQPPAFSACLEKYAFRARIPEIYTAALVCPKALNGFEARFKGKGKPEPFATREDALDYLRKSLEGSPTRDAQLDLYRENLNQLLQSSELNQLFDQAASINGQLARAGIELLPDPYPGIRPTPQELPGLLVAAALLSLGAPFWFNALKTLTNLRPLVATREQKEREAKT